MKAAIARPREGQPPNEPVVLTVVERLASCQGGARKAVG
jgi:hypothetical protein